MPDGFLKITKDFLKDILTTFPEYKEKLDDILKNLLLPTADPKLVKDLFDYCCKIYPERFFDILYQNADIFKSSEINTHFLPNINFKEIWSEDISDKTRNIIWKYLQLILFSIVGFQTEGKNFGDTAKFFEAIDENEFKNKLEETISQMTELFEKKDASGVDVLPDPEKLHSHISGLLDGQLGCLAKEIAEETAKEIDLDLNDVSSVGEVFQKLFKNPGKLMKIVKKVGDKLDAKLKSGEIKESELLKEASELMNKMGKTPGNMNNLLGQFGIGKKINKNAFQAHMQQNIKKAKLRERMKEKLERKQIKKSIVKKKQTNEVIQNTWIPSNYISEKKNKNIKKKKKKKKKK